MPTRRVSSLVWIGPAVGLALVLGGCTPGGQFDPTEMLSSDVFNTKKKLAGDREPLFPNGVPGAETGVPPDLMKGYQPPPEQADNADAAATPAPAAAPTKPKPKPKPKPAVAHATPKPPHDAAWDQKAASAPKAPSGQAPWPAPAQSAPAQTNWPSPPQTGTAQTNWPAPPQPAAAQTNWPAPPQAAPAQTNWPPPPPTGQHQ
jgi:hypothetical protein